jgi:hypothetical protein
LVVTSVRTLKSTSPPRPSTLLLTGSFHSFLVSSVVCFGVSRSAVCFGVSRSVVCFGVSRSAVLHYHASAEHTQPSSLLSSRAHPTVLSTFQPTPNCSLYNLVCFAHVLLSSLACVMGGVVRRMQRMQRMQRMLRSLSLCDVLPYIVKQYPGWVASPRAQVLWTRRWLPCRTLYQHAL